MRFWVVLFCWLLTSCQVYKDVTVESVRQLEFQEIGAQGVEGTLKVTINNPNRFSVELTDADIDLSLQGRKVARVRLAEHLLVPKQSKNEHLLKIKGTEANFEAALSSGFAILFAEEILIGGEGYVEGKALKISKKLPIKFEKPIKKSDLKKKKP